MLRTRRLLSSAAVAALVLSGAAGQAAHPDAASADTTDGTLTVVVDLDVNANGVYDSGIDSPQRGIKITVSDSGGQEVHGRTDKDGTYELAGTADLTGGRYFVVAEIPADLGLAPVPESDSYTALSTTVDVTSDSQSVRMGVVAKAPDPAPTPDPTVEPDPEPTKEPVPVSKPPAPKFAIAGVVWLDANRSGTQDADEPPAPGISVQLLDGDGDVVESDKTSSSGHYLLDKLAAGKYTVRFAGVPSGHRFTAAGVGNSDFDSDADPTGSTAPITLGVGTPGTRPATSADHIAADYVNSSIAAGIVKLQFAVGDHVWSDLNGDGVQQDNEPPASATVTLLDEMGRTVATTTTDDQGRYSFTGLTGGKYQLLFTNLPANRSFTLRGAGGDATRDSDVYATSGLTPPFTLSQRTASLQPVSEANLGTADYVEAGMNAGLVGTYSIGDTVWHDFNGDGVLDSTDSGVPGVTVELIGQNGQVVNSAVTSPTGRYTFSQLPAGSYKVKFSKLPTGLLFTAQHQGSNASRDSDANAGGESPVVTLGDDNPADNTIDAGVTAPASFRGSPAAAAGTAPAADTSLSSTGGVEPALPLGGLALVGIGTGCLILERRRSARRRAL